MNNRSMRLDTECDVTIDAAQGDNAGRVAAIRSVRDDLIAEHLGLGRIQVASAIEESGSIIAAIERFATDRLRPYQTPDLPAVERWRADNEVLDPEGPGEMFETLNKRGLFRRFLGPAP